MPRGKKNFRLPRFASSALYLLMKGLIVCVCVSVWCVCVWCVCVVVCVCVCVCVYTLAQNVAKTVIQ